MDGVAETQSLIDRYNEVLAMWGDPDADLEKVGAMQAELEDQIQSSNAWDLERQVEIAMEALRVPPGDVRCDSFRGERRVVVSALISSPDLLLLDEPTNHLMLNQLRGWSVFRTMTGRWCR